MSNPTEKTYGDLNLAYDFFNKTLFHGRLPRCLITGLHKGSCDKTQQASPDRQ
jgi:hypothetical protein